jgi:hypothetical protein
MTATRPAPAPVTLHLYRMRGGVRLMVARVPYEVYYDEILYWDGRAAAAALREACTAAVLAVSTTLHVDLDRILDVTVSRNSADGSPLFAVVLPDGETVYVSQTPLQSLDRWGKALNELREYRAVQV